MIEEELNRLEALAIGVNIERFDAGWYAPAKIESVVGKDAEFIAAASPATIISLIALARVGLAVTPRPIAEAPRDGMMFLAYSEDLSGNGLTPFWSGCAWHDDAGFCTDEIRDPTHFIPISAIPKPGGE